MNVAVACNADKAAFLGWQCRVRRAAMRMRGGRPDSACMPRLVLPDAAHRIVTVLCRLSEYSVTPELMHMARKSSDPAERREDAVRFMAATHYRSWHEFSDMLTAAFEPYSETAEETLEAGRCRLEFEAFSHSYSLSCKAERLAREHPLRAATWWHNFLFNPAIHPEAEIIGFRPDWNESQFAGPDPY
ncbi:MAG: hypothetical protein OXF74_05665 [Rhodobacteraceae bacterium]|nr:hypothetical protein [Paracoccaceae bacterium]